MTEKFGRTAMLLLLAAVVLVPVIGHASDDITRTFDAGSARTLLVDTDIGQIQIDSHAADQVEVVTKAYLG